MEGFYLHNYKLLKTTKVLLPKMLIHKYFNINVVKISIDTYQLLI